MSRRLAVAGRNRPTVPFENHRLGAHVDHGFNTDDHSLFEKRSSAACAVVRNTRGLVHLTPQTVSLQLPDNAVAETFGILLHSRGNVAYAISSLGLCRTFAKSLFGDFHQLPYFLGNFSHGERISRITNKPLHKRTAIHRYDVSLTENSLG